MSLKLLLVDDHKIMLDGLKSILKNEKEISDIFICQDSNDALDIIIKEQIDIALVDINMPGINGIELTEKIKTHHPSTKVIILTMNNALGSIKQALDAGAQGYILKNTDKKELMDSIRKIATKGTYFSKEVADILITGMANSDKKISNSSEKHYDLTPREIEIIKLVIKEYSNAKIAEILHISEYTVETHRKNILRKTNTKSIVGLVKYAYDNNIV
jgi:DNA-binding NarL/FixJ family response regulator